jgi:hypothetical protein
MEAEVQVSETNKREYSRVDAYVGMECRRLEPEEIDKVRSRISGEASLAELASSICRSSASPPQKLRSDGYPCGFEGLPEIEDPRLANWLQLLNAKLDAVIRMLSIQQEGFLRLPFLRINIGGGGLKFETREQYAVGNILEIKMMLSPHRPVAMYVCGEVVSVDARGGSSEVAVKFVLIDDEVRDEIVRFVFEKEREILREKRK